MAQPPVSPSPATPPVPSYTPLPRPGQGLKNKVLVIGVLVILLLIALALAAFLARQSGVPITDLSPEPYDDGEEVAAADIPPLNTTGSESPDDPIDQQILALKNDPALWSDLDPDNGAEQIQAAIRGKLSLASIDHDHDGLSNATEVLIYGTNPRYFDTDIDGASDGDEVERATDPFLATNTLSADAQSIVEQRIKYWGTDYVLTSDQEGQSQRDAERVAEVGGARVLLKMYYTQHKSYPVADTWESAWQQLKADNIGGLFSGTPQPGSWAEGIIDPLNTAPYVYTYSSDGASYTFSYALENHQTKYSFTGTAGAAGEAVKQPLSERAFPLQNKLSSVAEKIANKIVQTAQAHDYKSPAVLLTSDNKRLVINAYPESTHNWGPVIESHTLEEVKVLFEEAASTEGAGGECVDADFTCYCNNFVTFEYGENDAECQDIQVRGSATVVTGAAFTADATFLNTGTSIWREREGGALEKFSRHILGATSPQDTTRWGIARVSLGDKVIRRNEPAPFTINAVAPNTPGTYPFAWQMLEEGNEWFGEICKVDVTVRKPQCSDGSDNDSDGRRDCSDPGCWTDRSDPSTCNPQDDDEGDTQCSDGIDNDGDGKTDCGQGNPANADPGCWLRPLSSPPACNDNDDDEKDPPFNPGDIRETE